MSGYIVVNTYFDHVGVRQVSRCYGPYESRDKAKAAAAAMDVPHPDWLFVAPITPPESSP